MSRFQVVSGKGGTGKTTVAAALALALATEGRRTLLVEVEGRQGIAQLFGSEALPYEERAIAVAPGGGEVHALAIDAEQALLDYLQMFYKLGGAGRALKKLGAIDFATTVAPGVRDVLLTGKACEAVRRKDKQGRFVYDHVVMDAPPTGRITRFLNVNDEVAGLARIGPIHNQAQAVMRVLKSPETAVHLVTLLEEMPVQETADGIAELRAADLPVGRIVVNMVRPHLLDEDALRTASGGRRKEIAKALTRAGVTGSAGLVRPLVEQASAHAQRVGLEREQRAVLAGLGLPTVELPLVGEGVTLSSLHDLAAEFRKQGVGDETADAATAGPGGARRPARPGGGSARGMGS
ncbi:ArsA family ATPase [Streptomyces sp. NRRL WC-3549]|uniref:ArsA family ATPase n=1 Tax=Streptomyces sp. NRRL WC-3549 TaxID=1463925 RepID=UPI0004C7C4F9|nr:ArsA-related P-loop ATPase [Streptomyces sp. NRRL WC-3549]